MALSCGCKFSIRLLRIFRSLGAVTQSSAARGLRSDAAHMKPLASAAAEQSQPLPIVEGSVVSSNEIEETRRVLQLVNTQIADNGTGRLFAVVTIHGKQFKVTPEDLILVQADMPVDIGDSLRLEKVLLVGARDFTLLGRPLLDRGLVRVDATVVEKTLSQTKRNFVSSSARAMRGTSSTGSHTPYCVSTPLSSCVTSMQQQRGKRTHTSVSLTEQHVIST
uniref:Large ribosomal subunit protein bL21m n=1 Tax=Amblyomma triste TaxID=251400 RepID=A0A023G9Y3_AMBTT